MISINSILSHLETIARKSGCWKAAKKAIRSHNEGWVDAIFIIQGADAQRKVRRNVASKRRHTANPAEKKAKDRRWYLANQERVLAKVQNYIDGHIAVVAREYGTHCSICGSAHHMEWLHVRGNAFKNGNVSTLYSRKSDKAWRKEVAYGPCIRACRSCNITYDSNWAKEHGQSWESLNQFAIHKRAGL